MHVFVLWRCQDREDLIILERSLENSSFSCTTLILLEDRFDIWSMLSRIIVVVIHIYTSTPTLLSPSLDPAILDQEESCPDPPPPRSSDGVMEWAGLARCCCSLWGCDSHWAQSSLYIGSRSKVRITLTQHRVSWSWGWLLVLCSAPSVPQPVFTITEEALLLALPHLRHY